MPLAAITRVGRHLVAAVDLERRCAGSIARAADDAAQEDELRPEALCLPAREPRELGSADAIGEAEEVLDHRGVRGLSTRHVDLDHDRREPVGGGINGSSQPRRARADDRELVVLPRRGRGQVPCLRKQGDGRVSVHVVAVEDDGQVLRCKAVLGEQRRSLRRARFEKLVRLRRSREEITQAVMLRFEALTDDPYRRTNRAHSALSRNIGRSTWESAATGEAYAQCNTQQTWRGRAT